MYCVLCSAFLFINVKLLSTWFEWTFAHLVECQLYTWFCECLCRLWFRFYFTIKITSVEGLFNTILPLSSFFALWLALPVIVMTCLSIVHIFHTSLLTPGFKCCCIMLSVMYFYVHHFVHFLDRFCGFDGCGWRCEGSLGVCICE